MTLCFVCKTNPGTDFRHSDTVFCSSVCKSFYTRYWDIRRRCTDKKHKQYEDYGGCGRGICEEWMKFEQFRQDMLIPYFHSVATKGLEKTTIDRIDNEKGYSVDNCRWTTPTVQCYNRRKRKSSKSKYKGVKMAKGNGWQANIQHNGRRVYLGSYQTEEEARDVYKDYFEKNILPTFRDFRKV